MGQVDGRAFTAKDAIAAQSEALGFSFQGSATFVEITDYAGACGLAAQNQAPTDSRILDLGVAINDAEGNAYAPTGPGTFTVFPQSVLPPNENVAQVYYGGGCGTSEPYEGTAGTITLTNVGAGGSMEGSFDVMISCLPLSSCAGPDAHLTGTFSSAACAALNVNQTSVCK